MARDNALFQSLLKEFRGRIRDAYAPGDDLPSQRQWSQMFAVSQSTVFRVYKALEKEGLIRICSQRRSVRAPGSERRKGEGQLPRIGLITPMERSRWDTVSYFHYLPFLEAAKRRGVTIVEIPPLPSKQDPAFRWRVDWDWIPWNTFDVGLLMDVLDPVRTRDGRRPLLSMDHDLTAYGIDSVGYDNYFAGELMARHLFELGHRRFASLETVPNPGVPHDPAWIARRHGFEAEVGRLGGLLRPEWRIEISEKSFDQKLARFSSLPSNKRPTALFVPCSLMVEDLKLFSVLAQHRIRVPRDLSVVAFGTPNNPETSAFLTHVQMDNLKLVQRTLDAAEDIFRGTNHCPCITFPSNNGRETRRFLVPVMLAPRVSTCPPLAVRASSAQA